MKTLLALVVVLSFSCKKKDVLNNEIEQYYNIVFDGKNVKEGIWKCNIDNSNNLFFASNNGNEITSIIIADFHGIGEYDLSNRCDVQHNIAGSIYYSYGCVPVIGKMNIEEISLNNKYIIGSYESNICQNGQIFKISANFKLVYD